MAAGTGVRGAVKEVARRASAVARLQAELAKAEFARTGKNAGAGAGLALGAAFLGVFVFALLTALFVVALAYALPLWASILIVMIVYLLVAGGLVALSRDRFRHAKGMSVASEQARLTASALGLRRVAAAKPADEPATVAAPAPAPVPVDGPPDAAHG